MPHFTQSSCHIFGLPPELRILIYEYALVSGEAINVDTFSDSRHYSLTALLETCQVIRQEASPVFYKLNTFLAIIRQQSYGVPQNVSILPAFRTRKTANVGRIVILLVYDDGSKAYSRKATSTYLRRDGDRQPIDSAEEDEIRLSALIVSAICDRPPRHVVEWSRQHLDESLRWEVEDAIDDAEGDGDWDSLEKVRLRVLRFREQIAMLSEIPVHFSATGHLGRHVDQVDELRDSLNPRQSNK
ncbi:hypothetical protein LTR82_017459 [Friedmanniomyces endolithicus]|uniref:Uncharacterized protein n=1 Tax=Friedmanniomyces endolithicus TaxID=329885 RepID=A0AAN6F6V3_9PEZI|nr:hypothetical protein LTR82_017459 [Friedmanniomyces endolithicus]